MADEKKPSSRNVTSLDIQAKELGIGGNSSPETDENLYKKRMQKRKDIQSKSCLLYTSDAADDLL